MSVKPSYLGESPDGVREEDFAQIPVRAGVAPQGLRRRVVLTMGGKGGVGKTSVMAPLAEWYDMHQIPVTLLDLDAENKARGSLTHFFEGRVFKVNIHTTAGLDAFGIISPMVRDRLNIPRSKKGAGFHAFRPSAATFTNTET